MSPKELASARRRLGLTQARLADLLACDYTGFRRYEAGIRPVPRYIARSVTFLLFVKNLKALPQLMAKLPSSDTSR